jgi:hypothetical protein
MKSICFHCQFVAVGSNVGQSRCPVCSYPLITNLGGVALGTRDLEKLFAHATPAPKHKVPPLPGVSSEKRQAQLLMEKRRAKAQARLEAQRAQEREAEQIEKDWLRSQARWRALKSVLAAGAALAVFLLVVLNAL